MYRRMTPNAKIIISCREPCDGAFSLWKMRTRIKGRGEYGMSVKDMYDMELRLQEHDDWKRLAEQADRLDSGKNSVRITPTQPGTVLNSSMLRGFYYARVAKEFQKRFGKGNVLLIKFKDLVTDTEGTVRRIFEFLGLKPDVPLPDLRKIKPEDVLDMMSMEREDEHAALREEERMLLEEHFQVHNQEFAKMMGKPVAQLW